MAIRTWRTNADEFAALDKGEGWPFAALVACSVKKDDGNGNRSNRDSSGKVSGREFAMRAGTSPGRVMRYLATWEKAVRYGATPADQLTPDMVWEIAFPTIEFKKLYDASAAGSRPRDSKAGDAAKIIDRRGAAAVVAELTSAQKADVAREAMKDQRAARVVVNDPASRRTVNRAVVERETKAVERRKLTETPAKTQAREALAWDNTAQHGMEAVTEARMFARELPSHAPLSESQTDRAQYVIEQLEHAVEFMKSALHGDDIDSELAALLEEGN